MLTTEKVLASKARRKVQSSYRMQPTAQTSDLELYFFPCMPRWWLSAGSLTLQRTLCDLSRGRAEGMWHEMITGCACHTVAKHLLVARKLPGSMYARCLL